MRKNNKRISFHGYKETKIGLIPEKWELVKLKEFNNITAGGTPSTNNIEFWNGNIPWMNSGELNLRHVYDVEGRITESGLKNSSTKIIPKHSILMGLAGQGKTRGTVAINEIDLCTNQSVAAIIPDSIKYNHLFIYYFLDSQYDELRKLSAGDGGRGGLNLQLIGNLPIPLPPLPEQKKIADILSTWDSAIEKIEKLIDGKTKLKKGLMNKLLTGQKRFKESRLAHNKLMNHDPHEIHKKGIPEGWMSLRMNELFGQIKSTDDDVNKPKVVMTISGKYGFLSQNDKFNRVIAGYSLENYIHLKKGEFAYNRGNSKTYRFGCIYKLEIDEGLVPNVYICFKSKKELSEDFYKFYFEHGLLEQQLHRIISSSARGDGLLNVSSHDFFKMKVLYPPLKEQQRIASVLSTMDKEISTLNKKLNALKQQKKGLMQKLLTGEVRVRV